jgi:hypothetical protein
MARKCRATQCDYCGAFAPVQILATGLQSILSSIVGLLLVYLEKQAIGCKILKSLFAAGI